MGSIAVDTNTDGGLKRRDERCLEVIQNAQHLLLSTIVLGELLAGFACGEREAASGRNCADFWITARWKPLGWAWQRPMPMPWFTERLENRGGPFPPTTCGLQRGAWSMAQCCSAWMHTSTGLTVYDGSVAGQRFCPDVQAGGGMEMGEAAEAPAATANSQA
jgi:hypothetical protein